MHGSQFIVCVATRRRRCLPAHLLFSSRVWCIGEESIVEKICLESPLLIFWIRSCEFFPVNWKLLVTRTLSCESLQKIQPLLPHDNIGSEHYSAVLTSSSLVQRKPAKRTHFWKKKSSLRARQAQASRVSSTLIKFQHKNSNFSACTHSSAGRWISKMASWINDWKGLEAKLKRVRKGGVLTVSREGERQYWGKIFFLRTKSIIVGKKIGTEFTRKIFFS